jgi:hypothetical protein
MFEIQFILVFRGLSKVLKTFIHLYAGIMIFLNVNTLNELYPWIYDKIQLSYSSCVKTNEV